MFVLIGLLAGGIFGGLALGALLHNYWEDIRHWLNNTAADAVENLFGHEARRKMFKAISIADTVFRMVQGRKVATNVSTVYTKQSEEIYNKAVMINDVPADKLGQDYLNELKNSGNVMEMDYVQ